MIVIPRPQHFGIYGRFLWLWHSDGTGPAVFRWITNSHWEGIGLRLFPTMVMMPGWDVCGTDFRTFIPTDTVCAGMFLSGPRDYPEWFLSEYYAGQSGR